jgi:hypothetical protein
MIRIFSKRHEKAIFEKRLSLKLPRRLRRRIWAVLEKHNYFYDHQPDPNDRWTETTSVLEQVNVEICRRYGQDNLIAFNDENEKVVVDLKGFAQGAYPSQVLDLCELFYDALPDPKQVKFQCELNSAFEEEGSDWRLTDGQFFRVDSEFLALQVMARAHELMMAQGYEGALAEFTEARNDLASGDCKGAIVNACKSLESVLKTILKTDSGNASSLIRDLAKTDFYTDIPQEVSRAFGEAVLMALPFLRNRLGGHGQGEEVVEVPREYGELSIHLAAGFILFLVRRALGSIAPEKDDGQAVQPEGDDLPF